MIDTYFVYLCTLSSVSRTFRCLGALPTDVIPAYVHTVLLMALSFFLSIQRIPSDMMMMSTSLTDA
jgi:hypothetical protein